MPNANEETEGEAEPLENEESAESSTRASGTPNTNVEAPAEKDSSPLSAVAEPTPAKSVKAAKMSPAVPAKRKRGASGLKAVKKVQ